MPLLSRFRALVLSAALYASSFVSAQNGTYVDPAILDACPGYKAQNVVSNATGLTADLVLAGQACNVFGNDTATLKLEVTYETGALEPCTPHLNLTNPYRVDTRIHLKITDASTVRYEVPESILKRPGSDPSASSATAQIQFNYTANPFSFSIYRTQTEEILFDTTSHPIIFEPQYLRVKTSLPTNANVYGLGESTEPFRLPTYNLTRTLWSRDSVSLDCSSTTTELYGECELARDSDWHELVRQPPGILRAKANGHTWRASSQFRWHGHQDQLYFRRSAK